MKIKKITSFLLIMCLIFTSIGLQTINADASQADNNSIIERTDISDSSNPLNTDSEKADIATPILNNKDAAQSDGSALPITDTRDSNSRNKELEKKQEEVPSVNNGTDLPINDGLIKPSTEASKDGKSLITDLNESDEDSPQLNKAFVNGNILTLNFDEKLNNEKIPSTNDFKVRIIYNEESTEKGTGLVNPAYTVSLDPVYKSSTDTTVYPVLADNTKINEISVFDNKVVLTLADAVTSSSAVSLGYTSAGGDNLLCDQTGNAVESFSDYGVANYTGGSGIPDFVAEELYNELDTSLLSEKLARQIYYAMTECKGSRTEILAAAKEVVSILSDSNAAYKGFTDGNKLKLCKFFGISDAFFNYSEGKGENVEQTIIVYSKMAGLGLTEEEIEKSIQNNTRDQVISEKGQEGLIPSNRRSLLSTASGEEDPFADVKYDKQKTLSAPFKHNDGANEQINLGSGALDYNVTDVILPGAGGLNLEIERQYSTDQANYYDTYGRLQYGTNSKGKPLYSRMNVYESEKHFEKNADGTIGGSIESTSDKLKLDDFVGSYELKGFYNQKEIEDKGNYYAAHLHRYKMTTDTTNEMAAKQTTIPITKNDELWQLGTGWKLNFSYIEKDTYYYDFMKLHLSDGRDLGISPNWVNNLGHYTYKDVIFANESKEIRGQNSSNSVTYADGKKEYFNSDGRLIAIVDRFGNTISFTYTSVNNKVDITITDTLGRITTIKNEATGLGYNKVLKLPDEQTVTYVINQNTARKIKAFDKYESFEGQNNEYNLLSVINQAGEVTTYGYTDIECSAGFAARFKLTDKRKFMSTDPFDDGDKYYPNYYAGLSKITYPTGMSVNYEYYPRYNNWYDFGCIMDIAIKKRYDEQDSVKHNEKEYIYSYQFKKDGELRDILYSADGYSNTRREGREFDDWADYCIKEKDIDRNLTKEYYFDPRNGICTQEKNYLGNNLVQAISNEYRKYNLFFYQSKTKVTTERYDTSDKQPLRNIECYAYDDKGNAVSYWPSLAEGNTADNEYKVSMTYDNQYNYLTGKTYKKDAATTIFEQNVPSEDKKKIVQSMVYENGKLKARNDFAYDSYGNPIINRKYIDLAADTFIETNNVYKDGTYLTGIAVLNIKDADGKNLGSISRRAEQDIYGRLITETDGNGNVTSYTYDKLGRVTKVQYPDNSTKIYVYDTTTNKTIETDERGYVTRYQYDPSGNLIAVYSVDGGTDTLLKSNEYDSLYRLTKEQNNLSQGGGATVYTYDYKDRITKKCSVDSANKTLAQENSAYYDDKIIKTVEGDENSSAITTTEYSDKYGRVIKNGQLINGIEVYSTFDYNYLGEAVKEKSPRANVESYPEEFTAKNEYDYAGNVIKQYDVNGNYITTGYDAAGRKISVTDAKSNASGGKYKTVYTYDALGRVVKEETPFTDATVAVTKYYYDANGNLIQKQVKNSLPGAEESYTKVENVYNNKNKLIQVKSYNGSDLANQVDYEYDAVGNMTTMKTAQGTQHTKYEYDRYGHLTALTDPLGQKEIYTYDINGNMISKTDKNGVTTSYTYDGLARKLDQSVIKDEVTQSETMGYTQTGAMAFSQNENLRTDYIYDGQGRVIKETDSNGVEKEYNYDANGNLKNSAVKFNGIPKKIMTYIYDKKDRLVQVYEAGNLVAAYTYDVNGNRNNLTYGNGNSVDYAYNLANLVTSLQNKKGTGALSSYTYTYYLNGNQATKFDHKGQMTSYNYDGLGRLAKEAESGAADAITKAYTFDGAGNRASMTVSGKEAYTVGYTYDLNNRLAIETKQTSDTVENTDYYYDNNGNTIAKNTGILKNSSGTETPEVSIDMTGTEIYNYDGFDRMTEVQNSSGSSIYAYKPDGLRLSKTVNGVKSTQVWEGQDISLELDGNGEVNNRYIRGIGLINSDKNGWYLFNAHGDVVQLTDGTGNVTKEYFYDAFGNERNIDAKDSNPFRYCGEYFDKETGELYLRGRYYDSSVGRFITEDPAQDGINWYTYCENNPIAFIDPLGLERIVVSGGYYSNKKGYQYDFIDSALKELSSYWPCEKTTLFIANTGLTESDTSKIKGYVEDLGYDLQLFTDVSQVISYINNGSDNNRAGDQISNFRVFSHGLKGSLEFGYGMGLDKKGEEQLSLTVEKLSSIKRNAFKNAYSIFYSCNTGTASEGTSFAQEWSNITGGKTKAAIGRTNYAHINSLSLWDNPGGRVVWKSRRNAAGGYSVPYPSLRLPELSSDAKWKTFKPRN